MPIVSIFFFRYSAVGLPKKPTCKHNSKSLKCLSLANLDLFYFHKRLFVTYSKTEQDNYILKHIVVSKVKRFRPRKGSKNPRAFNVKFYIPKYKTNELIPVCKKTFLLASRLKSSRINGVAKRHFQTGSMAKENRGGDRKHFSFSSRKEAVEKFIKSFIPLESHYCRDQIKVRQYLHPDLNIKKMYQMYEDQVLPGYSVTQGFFRKIFNTRFNIGFGSPKTDVCSTCLQLNENIKIEKSQIKKQEFITQQRIHKLRAKQFYKMLQEELPGLLIISFDCEKNLPLPKIPDQAYYSRQLYLYNFTIVIGSSRASMTPQNIHAYIWTEDQAAKGSNEICSALYHCMNSLDLSGIEKIRLVSDGCGGQNKNSMVICMIMKWLSEKPSNIKEVEMIFPVTGHSFLPADRVFAINERVIKKRESIIKPNDYEIIIGEHATIHKLAAEIPIYDWKDKSKDFLKNTQSWHFQISKCKRIIFQKGNRNTVHVRGEVSYRNDICSYKSLTKRGKRLNELSLDIVPAGVPVKPAKLKDVKNLLTKHYGDEWENNENLDYYKNIFTRLDTRATTYDSDDNESLVDPGDLENEEITDFV